MCGRYQRIGSAPKHLVVVSAGSVVRLQLDTDEVWAGDSDRPAGMRLVHSAVFDFGGTEVFFPVLQLGVARTVRPNSGNPRKAGSGAAARRNSRRTPHGCCSSTATTSLSLSSIKRAAKSNIRTYQSLQASGSVVGIATWCMPVNGGTR